ncbi:MAG: haloacid dehalogenase type II [Gammaproteobacteria bacterium]
MSKFQDIQVCVFDAYGTLFDVHSAVARQRGRMGEVAERMSALWRSKQLEYTWLRSLMGRYADFQQVTEDALDYALDSFDLGDSGLRRDLMDAYFHLDCYPEVSTVLERLRHGNMRAAILSNGSPAMLEAAVASARLDGLFDAVLSVQEVGIFKPSPRVYQLAVDRLSTQPRAVCFLSSNAWDAAGAASFGFRAVWINRGGQRRERLPDPPEAEIQTLDELPPLLGL